MAVHHVYHPYLGQFIDSPLLQSLLWSIWCLLIGNGTLHIPVDVNIISCGVFDNNIWSTLTLFMIDWVLEPVVKHRVEVGHTKGMESLAHVNQCYISVISPIPLLECALSNKRFHHPKCQDQLPIANWYFKGNQTKPNHPK